MAESDPNASTFPAKPTRTRTFTPLDRIRELNSIDASIPQLLHAAGSAIQILGSQSPSKDLTSSKSQFLDSITTYFTTLSSIDVRLRRQVYALQEAGLIKEGDAKDAKRGGSAAAAALPGNGAGAGGGLDVGWLNGGGDQVEKDMEREVWRRAREFLETLRGQKTNEHGATEDGKTENGAGDGQDDRLQNMKEEHDVG
ncbi:hypothetical protein EPUS_04640 [Endocarpon pusillum Z07020]|uniref:Mediator of RNA polymerase II transcription subunit 11 n=1 Tax=Endocarpon pusillum (strain Z07020 / HMAS-L-300199) TaxID=1263415 RepID=U1FUQ5_ENDPU|nr:uncharacterized protein EPUS_04640 [Endocarpon pusillum Z07020]ERF68542.1 hypothetical protein EPUS_04640 [Endocarpon pusillum Z07020]